MAASNADTALQRFRNSKRNYDERIRPEMERIRATYASQGPAPINPDEFDSALEAHLRTFVIDALLKSLNWTPGGNIAPETPLASLERETTRFLDYLGFERDNCGAPLLIVEAKRPSSELPKPTAPSVIIDTHARVFAYGLKGGKLSGDWPKWIDTLRDYVQSVTRRTRCPKRAVITNGKWVVVFGNPHDAFGVDGERLAEHIHVFDEADVEARFPSIFEMLEYENVSGRLDPIAIEQLPMYLSADAATVAMHGLSVLYNEEPTNFDGVSPSIKVVPLLFVGSSAGTWICVRSRVLFEVPDDATKLDDHLASVAVAAAALASSLTSQLGREVPIRSLQEHYALGLASLSGVREVARNLYEVATGTATHYLQPAISAPACEWHEWGTARASGVEQGPHPIVSRSTAPRSFFISPEVHHCAHATVSLLKASRLTALNRPECGARSGENGQAFCEVFRFDERLCCRTCAFENVCTKARAFQLPCSR